LSAAEGGGFVSRRSGEAAPPASFFIYFSDFFSLNCELNLVK
jgi:hypothetical protein